MIIRALACIIAVLFARAPAHAATITVTSTANAVANDGQCTLREAITAANTNTASGAMAGECAAGVAGLDTIAFAIAGGGVQTIATISALPAISEAVTIDGYTQPLSSPNTNPLDAGINAVLLIELNQSSSGGLRINAAGTTIRGLVLNRGVDEITIAANDVTIAGNFIGTNQAGTVATPATGGGFAIRQTSGNDTLIGGPSTADRNLIAGDSQGGIIVERGDGNTIQGNYIGTDVTGMASLNPGSSQVGIDILGGSSFFLTTNTVIAGNLISGNGGGGMEITSPGGGVIQSNLIGTQRDGINALGNASIGLFLQGSGFLIGGTSPGLGNTIAFNQFAGGLIVAPNSPASEGNAILGNAIFSNPNASNSGLGINLRGTTFIGPLANDACDPDEAFVANHGQNYPVITSAPVAAGEVTISGTLNSAASTTFRVEFFSNVACDALGNGEGQTFLGFADVTTNGACTASFGPLVFAIPPGQLFFSATATDPANNTSEFSVCFPIAGPTTTTSSTTTSTTTSSTSTTTTTITTTTTPTTTPSTSTTTSTSTTSTTLITGIVDAFILPKRVTYVPNAADPARSRLVTAGIFDTGSQATDLGSAATLQIGDLIVNVSSLSRVGSAFVVKRDGFFFKVRPARTGSSKAIFRMKARGLVDASIDPNAPLTLRFANAETDGLGIVRLQNGRYKLRRVPGALIAPNLYLFRVKATLADGAEDRLAVRIGLATAGTTPATAPEVELAFGEQYHVTIPSAAFTKDGDRFVSRGAKGGAPSVALDFRRELLRVVASDIELGAFADGVVPLVVTVRLDAETRGNAVRAVKRGRSLKY